MLKKTAARMAAVLAGVAVPAWLYAHKVEPYWLEVSRGRLPAAGLPGGSERLKGLRLAFLSDLHLSRQTPPLPILTSAVEKIIEERPDAVLLGGDYFSFGNWNPHMTGLLAPLVRTGRPVVAVMGNHDYFGRRNEYRRVIEGFQAAGVRVLVNDVTCLEYNGAAVWIAGIDDYTKGEPDLLEMQSRLPAGVKPLVLLSHNPEFIRELPPDFAGVTLSGHTHGGQVNFAPPPFHRRFNWIRYSRGQHHSEFPLGWYTVNGNRLYVGRGLGMSGLQVRFNARPELLILEFI